MQWLAQFDMGWPEKKNTIDMEWPEKERKKESFHSEVVVKSSGLKERVRGGKMQRAG